VRPLGGILRCKDRTLDYSRRTLVMGVLNVTPDSFSDGGAYPTHDAAIAAARQLASDGADIIDVGGESTRPGADDVPAHVEIARVLPVVEALAGSGEAVVSVDTCKPTVAEAALAAGAHMVNDVTGLADPAMVSVVARHDAAVTIMHMQGAPRTMQDNPHYDDVVREIASYLSDRAEAATRAGVDRSSILVDPGIGFGKTALGHNLEILRRVDELASLGFPLLVGTSRKSFIGAILDGAAPDDRLEGTAATVALSIAGGANAVRVHDVREMSRVARVTDAVRHS
jgi:dihydropteroate synthase